jgi:hypothetical protein
MNKFVKIILNTLVYLIGVLSLVVIALSVLATFAGYGDKSILTLIERL